MQELLLSLTLLGYKYILEDRQQCFLGNSNLILVHVIVDLGNYQSVYLLYLRITCNLVVIRLVHHSLDVGKWPNVSNRPTSRIVWAISVQAFR